MSRLRPLRSARARILVYSLLLLAFSTVASIVIVRQILFIRLEDRVDRALEQEVQEFSRLVGGRDPQTGRPFGGDVRAIFDTFLRRNVPATDEVLFTFVADDPYKVSGGRDFPLEELTPLYDDWVNPTEAVRGEYDTSVGAVRYLSVPILGGRERGGTFTVVIFRRAERQEVEEAVRIAAAVSLGVLLLASLMAYLSAGRVLAPLRELRAAAHGITETDLSRRIAIEGDDELADLARTFNEMLDRIDAAFSTQRAFINDASHELRTPITIIRGHLEVMGDDPDERRETIALVTDELDRMARIVDDLLLLAIAERADFLRPGRVALDELADHVLAKARALAPRDWRLESTTTATVVGDQQRLTQALINLAENACEQTSEGDRIAIGVAANHEHARLWVTDEGPGVASADQERIFRRFARGSDGPRQGSGAGLGLAIVSAIAEAHGGRVTLRSRPGEGATFTITIPVDGSGHP